MKEVTGSFKLVAYQLRPTAHGLESSHRRIQMMQLKLWYWYVVLKLYRSVVLKLCLVQKMLFPLLFPSPSFVSTNEI